MKIPKKADPDRKRFERMRFTFIMNQWTKRYLWTQDDLEVEYLASGKTDDDKIKIFKKYYDKLGAGTFEDWVPQLLFRNEAFQQEYLGYMEMPWKNMADEQTRLLRIYDFYRKYGVWCPIGGKVRDSRVFVRSLLLTRASACRLIQKGDSKTSQFLARKYSALAKVNIQSGSYFRHIHPEMDDTSIREKILGGRDKNGEFVEGGNSLVITVDMSGPATSIRQSVERILDAHLPKTQSNPPKLKRWKWFLMVFDLKNLSLKPSRLTQMLGEIYGEDLEPGFTKSRVRYHVNDMKSIITKDYKKYLLRV